MIHADTFRVVDFNGAKGIVFLEGKMLAYRRDDKTNYEPSHIDLPGGGREGNESPFTTFKREVKEEFGLNISQEEIVFSCTIPSVMTPEKISFFIVAQARKAKPEDIIFGSEGLEWFLLKPEEFINHPDGIKRQQERVRKYLSGDLASV